MATYDYGQLFQYTDNGEVIIPDTPTVKEAVTGMFEFALGDNLDVSASSPIGRLIEAWTVMYVNILGVVAQNANGLNPYTAMGNWLDAIGAIFGVSRNDGESDEKYRIRIRNSQSRGKGFVQSIWNAVSNVSGVTSVCVLENGYEDPKVLPNQDNGIAVDGHSIFVCCNGGDQVEIASAIYSSKSAGCGYHMSSTEGTAVDQVVSDELTGTTTTVRFYRPVRKYVNFVVDVRGDAYTGVNIISDTKAIVTKFIDGRDANSFTTKNDIITAIGSAGLGIVCTNVNIRVSDSADSEGALVAPISSVDNLVVFPYQYVLVTDNDTTVNVS